MAVSERTDYKIMHKCTPLSSSSANKNSKNKLLMIHRTKRNYYSRIVSQYPLWTETLKWLSTGKSCLDAKNADQTIGTRTCSM